MSENQNLASILASGTGTIGSITVQSRSYTFEPLPDITAYELALATKALLPFLGQRGSFGPSLIYIIDNLSPDVKRHFRHHEAQ